MAQELKNKIVVLEPCTKTVEDLLKTITDRKQAELIRVSIPEEAVQLVRQYQPCMLVVCLHENNELPQRVTLFKNLESSIKYGLLKTLFVSKIKNKQVSTLITSLGITDFMEEPVPLRTLQFKANIQMKAIETIRKQQEQKKASQEKIVFKKAGQKEESADGSGDPQAKPTPALQLEEDAFLFKNSGVKKNGKKMVVELEGPDPASGEWVSHEDKGNSQAAWRWVPEEEKDSPEAKRGDGWVHSGDKPQFQEASQKWQMASEKPDLSYQKEGKKVAKKIAMNAAGEVTVAADSPKAEANIKKAKAAGKRAKERKAEKKLIAEQAEQEAKEAKIKAEAAPAAEAEKADSKSKASATEEEESSGPAPLELSGFEPKKRAKESAAGDEPAEDGAPVVDLKTHRQQKESKKAKGPALNPLEFLQKKKKEKQAKTEAEALVEEKPEGKDLPAAEEEAEESNRPAKLKVEALENPKAEKKKGKYDDKLDRLRAKLGDGIEKAEAEEERTEPVELELAAEEDRPESERHAEPAGEEAPEPGGPAPLLIGEKKTKKPKAPALPGLVGLTPKERKKKVLQEVQEMLAEPLPKELPPEEEKRLREKFGLEGAPEITPEALARKERLEKVKALKESLLDLETREAEEAAAETHTHDLAPDEIENTWSQPGGAGGEAGVARRAFDSDLPAEEETESDSLKTAALRRKKEKGENEDPYSYLPEIDLKPIGNAWEKAVEHQVYLSGEVRYRGFARMQDLLPLWIYKGERKPELLDKTKQWRFFGALPFSAQTLKEVPADVREFLLGLKAGESGSQLSAEDAEIAAALEEAEEVAAGETGPEDSEENEPGSGAEAETGAEDAIAEVKARKKHKGLDLAELNASLDKQSEDLEGAEIAAAPADRPVTQADTLEEIFEKKKKTGSITGALSESMKSPGIEKFLERRKKKEKSAEPAAVAQRSEPTNPYLGILVALSNSFGPAKDSQRAVGRVLKAIELSFGRCQCSILGAPDAGGQAVLQVGAGEIGAKIDTEGARPIRMKDSPEILGFLLLTPTEDRLGFTDQEEEVIQKVLESIWPALARDSERKAA